jgi:vancomycin resistance protein VanJ
MRAAGTYEKVLAKAYPYHALQGTAGLWSKLPLSDTQPIDIIDYGPLADTKPAVRGVQADSSWVRPADGSDHRPVEARISW